MYGLLCFLIVFTLIKCGFCQPIGNTYVAGTTWYDLQHNGSCGRMITLDVEGNAHVVWTNGLDSARTQRHVFYNLWNAETLSFDTMGGEQLDYERRGGFTTITMVGSYCPIATYHSLPDSDYNAHAAVNLCLLEQFTIPWLYENNTPVPMAWPHITCDINGVFHAISSEDNNIGDNVYPIYYSRGLPQFDANGFPIGVEWNSYEDSAFLLIDTTKFSSQAITSSRINNRIAMCWSRSRTGMLEYYSADSIYDANIYIKFSEDGGQNWADRRNITQFIGLIQNTERDTLRAHEDLSLLFDRENRLHVAFTTQRYYALQDSASHSKSLIYHWNELTEQFSLVANGWIESRYLGFYTINTQQPSLAIDESSGYLYCAYARHDTSTFTSRGFASADIWISVSTDNGSSWSVGTNVTRTTPIGHPVPQGESLHEREPTLAEKVTNGFVHLTYVLDHDAGAVPSSEGIATLNEFIYQRIPVDSIPTTPILQNYPLRWDSTGFLAVKESDRSGVIRDFQLNSPYPNPFNSSTKISFELPNSSRVELKVYNVLGREVETLKSGLVQRGHHEIIWNAEKHSSGIYFVNLKAENLSKTQKVFYLK